MRWSPEKKKENKKKATESKQGWLGGMLARSVCRSVGRSGDRSVGWVAPSPRDGCGAAPMRAARMGTDRRPPHLLIAGKNKLTQLA